MAGECSTFCVRCLYWSKKKIITEFWADLPGTILIKCPTFTDISPLPSRETVEGGGVDGWVP
jgi:hypothetical protein